MKFLIRRTSNRFRFDPDKPPIKGCRAEKFTAVETYAFKSFDAYEVVHRMPFTARGSNHRLILGPRGGKYGIARDFVDSKLGWFIDVDSLEELLALADCQGEVIIGRNDDNEDIRQIEIYDGYRE